MALLCLAPRVGAAESRRSVADLDGHYVTIGATGSALCSDHGLEAAFGGELGYVRIRESALLGAYGLAIAGSRFSDSEGGRLAFEAVAATRFPFDVGIGAAVGLIADIDGTTPPRYGWQATLLVYAGVVPFVRAGHVESRGRFVELGIKIPLPALRR